MSDYNNILTSLKIKRTIAQWKLSYMAKFVDDYTLDSKAQVNNKIDTLKALYNFWRYNVKSNIRS